MPEVIAIIDLQGRVEISTDLAAKLFNLKPDTYVRTLSLEWFDDLYNQILRNPHHKDGFENPVFQHFVGGEEKFFLPKTFSITTLDEELSAVLLTISDVTRQHEHTEIKKNVVSTVSHQLKTPLTSIRLAIHLLLDQNIGTLNQQQIEVLSGAEEESRRLNRILEDLLDIGRIESGKATLDLNTLSPSNLVIESVEPLRASCRDAGVELLIVLPEDLPQVLADSKRIPHVFSNLISNALEHTNPGGKITVSAKAENEFVLFSISDTGKGIPERYLSTIFERFFRVPEQERHSGVGLGLAIAKEIVEAHGGKITADSNEHVGSTFTFSLPVSTTFI